MFFIMLHYIYGFNVAAIEPLHNIRVIFKCMNDNEAAKLCINYNKSRALTWIEEIDFIYIWY